MSAEPGTIAPPLAYDRFATVPGLRGLPTLWSMIADPVGLAERLAQRYGDVFTIRIPFAFDLTYLLGPRAYRTVMSLPVSHAMIGPVMSNVPGIGFWFPRTGRDTDSLQELVIAGRRLLAGLMTRQRLDELAVMTTAVAARRVAGWSERTDLASEVPAAVNEAAIRCLGGDALWELAGEELVPLLRDIANGIDIPRAALARTPLHPLMPEYRATRRLAAVLRPAYATLRREGGSPAVAAIERMGLADADAVWMLMYVLWNATAYPGSYTLWTLVDILERPSLLDRIQTEADAARRTTLLGWCLWETIRLHPISSLVRHLAQPLIYDTGERRYQVPAGGYVGVLPMLLNRDPARFGQADVYDPTRYATGERPTGFGRGPFSCVAQEFSRLLTALTLDEVLRVARPSLTGAAPARRVRVHLTYPSGAVLAATGSPAPR